MSTKRSKNIDTLNPEFLARLLDVMSECPFMAVWEAGRSFERQNYLYAKGPKVTKARGGESPHNFYAAADLVLDPDVVLLPIRRAKGRDWPSLWDMTRQANRELWSLYGASCKRNGLVWGGDFGKKNKYGFGFDPPHCELESWRDLR